MRFIYLIIYSIFLINFSVLTANCQVIDIKDMQFKKGTVENYDSGEFKSGKLSESTKVLNFICKNILELYKNGNLKSCRLAEEVKYIEINFPKNTQLFFTEDSTLEYCWLGKNTEIQGVPCKGGQQTQTSFHKNGKILCCFISRPFEIQKVYCKSSLLAPVCFFPDGRLQECTTEIDQKVNGRFVKAGSKLLF